MVKHSRHTGVPIDVGAGAKAIQQPINGTDETKSLLESNQLGVECVQCSSLLKPWVILVL